MIYLRHAFYGHDIGEKLISPNQKIPTLQAGFWDIAIKYPDYHALEIDNKIYSYRKLSGLASQFTQAILEINSQAQMVAIIGEKNIAAYAGVLGILTAGKTYCPLGAKFPPARQKDILTQSEAEIIIVGEEFYDDLRDFLALCSKPLHILSLGMMAEDIQANYPAHHYLNIYDCPSNFALVPLGAQDDYAYLLFTSGSTGKPKGVPVRHRNALSCIDNVRKIFAITSQDRISQVFSLSFDVSVHDLFVSWLSGACLCTVPESAMLAPSKLIQDKKLTIFASVPSQIEMMKKLNLLEKNNFPNLRLSMFCGEAFNINLAKAWKIAAPNSAIYNGYGPSEASILTSLYCLQENDDNVLNDYMSVGKALEGFDCMIDDDGGQHNFQEQGELLLSGAQVIDGYWKNPDQTESKFINLQGKKGLWYRTGDIIARDKNGLMYFVSRADHQIKLHGHRIELEEIAAIIRKIANVDSACVIVSAEQQLIAFIAGRDGDFDFNKLKNQSRDFLPSYMVPDKIMALASLPLNANGKIDRVALTNLL